MIKIKQYVDGLFRELPDSEMKQELQDEIVQNLNEKVIDLIASGKDEEDAINKAIVEFGDISDIKEELLAQQPEKSKAAMALGFSLWGSMLIIALVVFANLYYTPKAIWCVYPIFGVLWWPLAMFYRWLSKRKKS